MRLCTHRHFWDGEFRCWPNDLAPCASLGVERAEVLVDPGVGHHIHCETLRHDAHLPVHAMGHDVPHLELVLLAGVLLGICVRASKQAACTTQKKTETCRGNTRELIHAHPHDALVRTNKAPWLHVIQRHVRPVPPPRLQPCLQPAHHPRHATGHCKGGCLRCGDGCTTQRTSQSLSPVFLHTSQPYCPACKPPPTKPVPRPKGWLSVSEMESCIGLAMCVILTRLPASSTANSGTGKKPTLEAGAPPAASARAMACSAGPQTPPRAGGRSGRRLSERR